MIIVALLAAGVCILSVALIGHVSSEMDSMRTEVLALSDAGRMNDARLRLQQMAEAWKKHEPLLAILVSHDTLHEITGLIIEGHANLSADDADDFSRSMALLGEALRHLHVEELPHLANILSVC